MARSPAKRFFGTILFIIAVAGLLGFGFLLFADSENINSVPGVSEIPTVAQVLGVALAVIALVLAILILVRAGRDTDDEDMFFIPEKDMRKLPYDYREPAPDDSPDTDNFEVYNLPNVPRQEHAWEKPEQGGRVHPYYFPRSVEDALYTNDYITIDAAGTRIKLRTVIAGPKGNQRAELKRPYKRHVDNLKKQEQERIAEEEAAKLQTAEPGDGEAFMEALETRATGDEEPANGNAPEEVFYGYGGDNPGVDSVEEIDSDSAGKLRAAGVETVARLLFEDAGQLSRRSGIEAARIQAWQSTAELMKVNGIGPATAALLTAAGVKGVSELKRRSAKAIADGYNDVADAQDASRITPRRVEGWQEAAKELRRTRQRVPAA